jgi:hypothetical protein
MAEIETYVGVEEVENFAEISFSDPKIRGLEALDPTNKEVDEMKSDDKPLPHSGIKPQKILMKEKENKENMLDSQSTMDRYGFVSRIFKSTRNNAHPRGGSRNIRLNSHYGLLELH